METHSSLKYWPSCGMMSECVISRWGASAKRRQKKKHKKVVLTQNATVVSSVLTEQLLAIAHITILFRH